MSDFADRLLARVRALLKRHPAFAGMKRDDLDLYLADLEADLHRDLEDLIAEEVAGALREAEAEAEADREYEVWAEEQAKSKRGQKKITTEQPRAATS
jgi:hypothetical protein